MINLKQFLEICSYRISEGSDYGWESFGANAYVLDSWDGDNENGHSLSIIFDTQNQTVYQVEVHDYKNERAYRYTNPEFNEVYTAEEKSRGSKFDDEDDYVITTLEVEEDWLEKATAIVNYQEYNTGILIPLDFTDEELLPIFKLAHAADVTFNEYVAQALRAKIDELTRSGTIVPDDADK